MEMRTPHSCGMKTDLGFKTSHPLLFQREWKGLKWVVWKQREFTFGQEHVSSPERKGAELCWELVVPEGGKEYQGDEVSSRKLLVGKQPMELWQWSGQQLVALRLSDTLSNAFSPSSKLKEAARVAVRGELSMHC